MMPSRHDANFRMRDRIRAQSDFDRAEREKRSGLGAAGHRQRRLDVVAELERMSRQLAARCTWLDEFASVAKSDRDRLDQYAREFWTFAQFMRREVNAVCDE